MADTGDHARANAEYRDVLAAQLRVLGPDHPSTLTTRHQIAREMAYAGDHAGAEAEYRDVLATVASGIRCKSDGRGSGFMVMLGDDTDIPGGVAVLGSGYFA
jgi:hypothetical protein